MLTTAVTQATTAIAQTTTAQGGIINTFWNWSQWEQLGTVLGVLIYVGTVIGAVCATIRGISYVRLRRECKTYLENKYDNDLEGLRKYYIHTRGQDTDPCNDANLNDKNKIPNLISYFLKKSCKGKVYLILADSGMGKTTFLLKLYQTYAKRVFICRKKRWIHHISLSESDCLDTIRKKREEDEEHHRSSILLLDSLDEQHCNRDAKQFLEDVLKASEDFYRIIITCRTQYFENAKEEYIYIPYNDLGGGGSRVHLIRKYLSPFSDKDVDNYLKKKFPYNRKKRKQAKEVIAKAPSLAVRPMILSWIDELCDDTEQTYDFSCQIYEKIVDKWLDRESPVLVRDKNGNSIENQEKAKEKLFQFCLEVAKYLFQHHTERISLDELKEISNEIDLNALTSRTRTLLNRDSEGNYKFSHKSFYEYLVSYLWHFHYEDWMEEYWRVCTPEMREFMGEESAIKVKKYVMEEKKYLLKRLTCLKFFDLSSSEIEKNKDNLSGADLRKADLREADLNGADLNGADLREADLSGAHLNGAHLSGAHLSGAHLSGAHLNEAHLNRAYLNEAHLNGADLRVADLSGANLHKAELLGAHLNGAELFRADLNGADLNGAHLNRAYLIGAELQRADLRGAKLESINYDKDTDFTDAKLDAPVEELAKKMNWRKLDA